MRLLVKHGILLETQYLKIVSYLLVGVKEKKKGKRT